MFEPPATSLSRFWKGWGMFAKRFFLLGSIQPRLLVVVLLASAAGCGNRKADVSGEVHFRGSPLPDGKITFVCEGGDKPVLSTSIRDGKYELRGVPVGPVKITVATHPPGAPGQPPPGMGSMKPPKREPPGQQPQQSGQYVEIPRRYSQIDQSNLDCVIQPGSQVHNIDLDP